MDRLDHAPIDLGIRAHALAATLSETPLGAHEEHAKVLAAWNDPEAAEGALRRAWPAETDAQLDRRLARVLNAVGAARIFVADERRHAEVESVKLPAYAGAIEHGALTAYAPASVIAAGAAVGAMWGELADDFRRVPMPAAWKKEPALHKEYFDALEAMSEPIRTRFAKPAMKKCPDLSIKYAYADASSRACEAWLVSHYKTEFPAVDEIIPGLRQPPGPGAALRRPDPPLREPSPPPDR